MEHKKILILEQNDIGMSGFSIRITVTRQSQIISGLHIYIVLESLKYLNLKSTINTSFKFVSLW